MKTLLLRIHITIKAYWVKFFRTRTLLQAFAIAHAAELTTTPVTMWPMVIARQEHERRAISAGKLEAIVDRKSWAWPFMPSSVHRLSTAILKPTPYNLRRMSRTPVPRRAMNLIKGALISQPWGLRAVADVDPIDDEMDQEERIKIGRTIFAHPNNEDSFQTFMEKGLEDMCIFGALVAEISLTLDYKRPVKMWPVNVESVRIFPAWTESTPDMPHYAQMTGLKGERGGILFFDDELMYVRDNPSTDSPFGLGKMEVGFSAIADFIGIQSMSGKAGSDQIHKSFLWWEQPQNDSSYQIVRRHIQNEMEGQAKVAIIGGMKKPEVLEINPVVEADLLLNWQELLIRMIANAFDMSAMALGVEHDINRAVGEVLDDKDFRSAVVPMAKRVAEAITRKIIHEKLGWYDLEFAFFNLDDPDAQTKVDMHGKLYSMNATTPNRILKAMNMAPLETLFGDLTQFEAMMLNLQASAELQKLQMASQQGAPQLPAILGPGGQPETPNEGTPDGMSKGSKNGRQPPAPAKLGLRKFPIAGSQYNAREIAAMEVAQITTVLAQSGLTAPQFLGELEKQEPGILQTLTDSTKEFLQQRLKDEETKPKKKIPAKTIKRWEKELAVKYQKQNRRTSDMSEWITKAGQQPNKMNVGSSPASTAGTPGKLNTPVTKPGGRI